LNRTWLIGGVLVLLGAALFGWLNASKDAQLDVALVLADATTPGCDGAGQVHLVLGNAADKPMTKVEGVLSVAGSDSEQPVPVGNFELKGTFAPGQKSEACVAVDEGRLASRDRKGLVWLARATAIEFVAN
jgi:hypothetical protein